MAPMACASRGRTGRRYKNPFTVTTCSAWWRNWPPPAPAEAFGFTTGARGWSPPVGGRNATWDTAPAGMARDAGPTALTSGPGRWFHRPFTLWFVEYRADLPIQRQAGDSGSARGREDAKRNKDKYVAAAHRRGHRLCVGFLPGTGGVLFALGAAGRIPLQRPVVRAVQVLAFAAGGRDGLPGIRRHCVRGRLRLAVGDVFLGTPDALLHAGDPLVPRAGPAFPAEEQDPRRRSPVRDPHCLAALGRGEHGDPRDDADGPGRDHRFSGGRVAVLHR